MERELPPGVPVTLSTPASDSGPGEVLSSGRPPRPTARRAVRAVALSATAVLAAGVLVARGAREPTPTSRADPAAASPAARPAVPGTDGAPDDSITALATLGAARTDQRFVQRLTLTVVLEPDDGRGADGARPLGEEVALVDVRVRGLAVVLDDARTPIPLGRFGRADVGRATTVSLEAAVTDCSIEPQARREVRLALRTGDGPVRVLQATVQPELVRALDRLVARACRRPRG